MSIQFEGAERFPLGDDPVVENFIDTHLAWAESLRKWVPFFIVFGNLMVTLGILVASVSGFRLLAEFFGLLTYDSIDKIYTGVGLVIYQPFDNVLNELSIPVISDGQKDVFVLYLMLVGAVWRADRTLGWRKADPDFNVEDESELDRNVALLLSGQYKAKNILVRWLPLIPTIMKLRLLRFLGRSFLFNALNYITSLIIYIVLSVPIIIWHMIYRGHHFTSFIFAQRFYLGKGMSINFSVPVIVSFASAIAFQSIAVVLLSSAMIGFAIIAG